MKYCKLRASLGYTTRLCLKTKPNQNNIPNERFKIYLVSIPPSIKEKLTHSSNLIQKLHLTKLNSLRSNKENTRPATPEQFPLGEGFREKSELRLHMTDTLILP